jgi:sugar-specific transcriptional regulator TrmB
MKELGLTHNQARVYLALIEMGPSKAEEISKLSEVTRQDIYRIMPNLQKLGFVEKTLSRPVIFKALPLEETLSTLVTQREKKTTELKKITSMMLKKHINKNSKKSYEDYHIKYIPAKGALISKTGEAMGRAKKSLYAVSSLKNVFQHRFSVRKDNKIMKNINRNIEIKFVTEKPKKPDKISKTPKNGFFSKLSNFNIRFSTDTPEVHLLIIDKREVFIRIFPKSEFSESPVLWSNNPSIVILAQSYFEKMWNKSVDPNDI